MKHLTLFVAAVLAIVVAGCAGNGGDDHTQVPQETISQPRIEAVVRVERTNLRNPAQYTDDELQNPQIVNPADLIVPTVFGVQDLRNFQTNESYYFQLVGYTPNGERVILPATFTTDDTEFEHGVVGNSGLYLANDVPTGESLFVFADYNGTRYSAEYDLNERQVRVIGHVLTDDAAKTPIEGVTVEFYNDLGVLQGVATTGYDGSFRASVPLSVTSFTVNSQLLSNRYFRSYVAGGLRFNAGDAECRTPVTFDAVGTTTLEDIFVTPFVAGQTTPLPDGCVP